MAKLLLTILYPGVAEWEVVFPLFCVHPRIEYQFAAVGERRVRGTMGFELEAQWAIENVDPEDFEGIYLPGPSPPPGGAFPAKPGRARRALEPPAGVRRPRQGGGRDLRRTTDPRRSRTARGEGLRLRYQRGDARLARQRPSRG